MKDLIVIEQLAIDATIGIYDWEKIIKQKLVLNLEMSWDSEKGAKSKDINDCLNYAEVSQLVIEYIQSQPFLLIETVAYDVIELLQQRYAIEWIRLKVSKPSAVPEAKNVAIIVERGTR